MTVEPWNVNDAHIFRLLMQRDGKMMTATEIQLRRQLPSYSTRVLCANVKAIAMQPLEKLWEAAGRVFVKELIAAEKICVAPIIEELCTVGRCNPLEVLARNYGDKNASV